VRTTWRLDRDPRAVLDLLQERLTAAEDVTAVDRTDDVLVVRSRAIPTWAYFFSTFFGPQGLGRLLLRARQDQTLRITACNGAIDRTLTLEGDANAGVSRVLVITKNEIFPPKTDQS
jgi:hypothetical protein